MPSTEETGGASPSPSPTSTQTGAGRPLQVIICDSNSETEPMKLNEEALAELRRSFKKIQEKHGHELPISVVSMAGAFREGKSLMLDCFLRYLHHVENTNADDFVLEVPVESSFLENCNIIEPLEDGSEMFETRSSIERVTSGIWIYSRPFVLTNSEGEKIAVILMDTQGLFDTAAVSVLDAPIFALSVLLSSKQIINKRGQFNSNDWQLLNLFTEFANEVVRRLHRNKDPELLGEKAFQNLEFLARDFQNFDMEIEDVGTEKENGEKITMDDFLEHCTKSSQQYLDHMTLQMSKYHSTVGDRIRDLYQTRTCTCLSHPGDKMTSKRWDGSSDALSDSFRALTARYCRTTFSDPAPKCDILGNPMTFESFATWVEKFTDCMVTSLKAGNLPSVDEVVKVVTQHQLTALEQEAVENIKRSLTEASKDGTVHILEDQLEILVQKLRGEQVKQFAEAAQFGPEEQIKAAAESLNKRLDEVERTFRDRNKLAMSQMFVFVAPAITVAAALYFVDWVSDWVCDPWLDACVMASTIMAAVYTFVFVGFAIYVATKWKTYGPNRIWAAIGPLGSNVATNFETVFGKAKAILGIKDPVDSIAGSHTSKTESKKDR